MGNDKKALFGVFDGHGGREVAVFCKNHYLNILEKQKNDDADKDRTTEEWLRQSFLKVDDELRDNKG